jgi:hypothetical protein
MTVYTVVIQVEDNVKTPPTTGTITVKVCKWTIQRIPKGNHKWTIQRNWQHRVHNTKTNKAKK